MLLGRDWTPQESDDYGVADANALKRMLKSTRDREFRMALDPVQARVDSGTWLDVGCSYGWFLQQVAARGYDPFGVEPSPIAFAEAAGMFGGRVLNGEFRSALEGAAVMPRRFDVLSTMDVLEHVQDPAPFLQAAREHLAPGGTLLVKVPSNDGLLFRLLSRLATRTRNGALGRMWQVDFNYPHWHYYSPASIRAMLARNGFSTEAECRLPFAFLSTVTDRVRSYESTRESLAALMAKSAVASSLVAASYMSKRFDSLIVLARPR
jgi:SAM-dependent methyltransferase